MTLQNKIEQTAAYLQTLDPEFDLNSANFNELHENNSAKQTLAIKILSIFGGLLSSAAFFGFLMVAGLYKSNIALSVFGVLAIAAAVVIAKKSKQIIWDSISVATFSVGFSMLGMSLSEFGVHDQFISLCFAVLSLLCLCLAPNYIISFVATLILNASILTFILSTNQKDLIHIQVSSLAIVLSYSFILESKLLYQSFKKGLYFHAIRTALIFCFLIGLSLVSDNIFFSLSDHWRWSTSIVCIFLILFFAFKMLTGFGISDKTYKLLIYGSTLLVTVPTILYPGLTGSMLLLLLCFRVDYKTGFIMGIIALLWFIGKFYYDLNYTLLTKSILMFLSGVLFLLFYYFITKRKNHEKI